MGTKCIEVNSARLPSGYGVSQIYIGGKSYTVYAHRMAWELAHGPIPAGLFVCHACDNPPCINVEHLFLGTARRNSEDMKAKGRGAGRFTGMTHCIKGHDLKDARLYRGKRYCRECDRLRPRRDAA